MAEFNYERREIQRVMELDPNATYKIKITSEMGQTRWLNITTEQLNEIEEILVGRRQSAATLTKHGKTKHGPQPKYRRNPDVVARETARRARIIALIADGYENDQIAARLHMSVSLVKKDVHLMLAEYRLSNRAHLVGWVYRTGFLKLDQQEGDWDGRGLARG